MQDQHQCKSVRDAATTFNYNHDHHRPGPTQRDAAITATCIRAHEVLTNPYADASPALCTLCLDLCILSLWCYFFYQPAQVLHLHTWWWSLAATCADGGFSSAIGANTPCTGGGATRCNLRWWSFSFHPLAHILHLCSDNLHCVVVYIYIFIFIYIYAVCHAV